MRWTSRYHSWYHSSSCCHGLFVLTVVVNSAWSTLCINQKINIIRVLASVNSNCCPGLLLLTVVVCVVDCMHTARDGYDMSVEVFMTFVTHLLKFSCCGCVCREHAAGATDDYGHSFSVSFLRCLSCEGAR